MLPPFLPYLGLSLVHLLLLTLGPDWSVTATKALLMPALVLAVLLAAPRPRGTACWLLVAGLGFSWGGDVALSFPGDGWFTVGLGSFLAAHLVYLALFLRLSRGSGSLRLHRRRRVPIWALVVYPLWFAGFLALLGPHTGALLVPVAAYGLALGAMAAFAAGDGPLLAAGGALFVVSDSVLGLGRFLPGYDFAWHDAVVMVSYLAAQGLIALGVVVHLRVAAMRSAAPVRRAAATAR
ncbi:lysoplasmalogenase [Agromyces mediolanus]|uniref:lysoplasmalogenase n=1 Tax=Agromyces mediolanus TaxID=41986 RepID=UPI0038364A09